MVPCWRESCGSVVSSRSAVLIPPNNATKLIPIINIFPYNTTRKLRHPQVATNTFIYFHCHLSLNGIVRIKQWPLPKIALSLSYIRNIYLSGMSESKRATPLF